MQVTDELIRGVVQQVLAGMRNGKAPTNGNGQSNGSTPKRPAVQRGVFADVESAVAAATAAQREFERRGLNDRRKALDCIRKIKLSI